MMGMQLNFDKRDIPKPSTVLTEDLEVWKVGKLEDNQFTSRYQKYVYLRNEKVPNQDMRTSRYPDGTIYVQEAYHAFLTKEMAEFFSKVYPNTGFEDVVKFIIPSGARVHYECFGKQVASSRIIYTG